MGAPFVLDASLTLSWVLDDEATPFSGYVFEILNSASAEAPALWPFEVANVLNIAERQGRLKPPQYADALEILRLLPVEIEHRPALWLWQRILPLARKYRLTGYDAAYLELAMRERLPLATLDGDLRNAAVSAGVPLFASGYGEPIPPFAV